MMCVSHTSCRISIVIQILQKKHKSNQYFLMQTWIMVWDSFEILFPAKNIHNTPGEKHSSDKFYYVEISRGQT